MGFYRSIILPRLINRACAIGPVMEMRSKLVPNARGRVLEIGVGSGLNFRFYDPSKVGRVVGVDPEPEMLRMAARAERPGGLDVELMPVGAEEIPFDDASFDTVVLTYTLCTIPEPARALREMRRVLRPGGRMIFCEHGLSPDARVRRWQNRVQPVWGRLAGGCHLNRDVPALIRAGGFEVRSIETGYLPGWRPATFHYWGEAA